MSRHFQQPYRRYRLSASDNQQLDLGRFQIAISLVETFGKDIDAPIGQWLLDCCRTTSCNQSKTKLNIEIVGNFQILCPPSPAFVRLYIKNE